jgi:hypothetical protein
MYIFNLIKNKLKQNTLNDFINLHVINKYFKMPDKILLPLFNATI